MPSGVLPVPHRPLRLGDIEEIFDVPTSDGREIRLTRFPVGTKGPVVLAPGYGTSTLAWTIDTVETNFPEFLAEHGYDIWLLDYRASPMLPAASTDYTIDDIATRDWPAAIDKVREVTRGRVGAGGPSLRRLALVPDGDGRGHGRRALGALFAARPAPGAGGAQPGEGAGPDGGAVARRRDRAADHDVPELGVRGPGARTGDAALADAGEVRQRGLPSDPVHLRRGLRPRSAQRSRPTTPSSTSSARPA